MIIREFDEIPDLGFVSVSNDEKVKIWTYDGDLLHEFSGHTGFIFTVKVLPD